MLGKGGESQPKSTTVHRSPNKHWRSNSIFNLWCRQSISLFCHRGIYATNPPLCPNSFQKQILFFTSIQRLCPYQSVQERNRVASAYWISVRNLRCRGKGLKLFLLGLWCKKVCKISLQKAERINIQVQSSIQCAVLIEMKSKRRMGINVVGYFSKHYKCTIVFFLCFLISLAFLFVIFGGGSEIIRIKGK
jgi:hypothetical protein